MREPRKKLEEPSVAESIGTGIGATIITVIVLVILGGIFMAGKFFILRVIPDLWKKEPSLVIGLGIAACQLL